jgi:hypothetical protein
MYILAPEAISTTYFVNPSYQSVCLHVYPSLVARQRLGKTLPQHEYTCNNRRIAGRVVLYAVRVVSKESR